MPKKPTTKSLLASIKKELRSLYSQEHFDRDDPSLVITGRITPEGIERVLALATPLCRLITGEVPYPWPFSDDTLPGTPWDIQELAQLKRLEHYSTTLQEAGFSFERLMPIPARLPPAPLAVAVVIGQQEWADRIHFFTMWDDPMINVLHHLGQVEAHDPYMVKLESLHQAFYAFCERHEYGGLLGERDFCWLIESYAFEQVNHDPQPEDRLRAATIERLLPALLRWPLLGPHPNDPTTLCVLVG